MTTATFTEASLELIEAVDEVFEDAECCRCDRLAVVIGTLKPCGHEFPACKDHRRQIHSHLSWRIYAGKPLSCGPCASLVTGIAWRPR